VQEDVLIVDKQDFVCTIIFNRPEKRNALSAELLERFVEAMNDIDEDRSIRVIVVRGAGDEAFSAGYDIGAIRPNLKELPEPGTMGTDVVPGGNWLRLATDRITGHRCPVIGMINGLAMGAGCDVAAACDLRVAADTATFRIPVAKIGASYDPDAVQRLIDLVGVAAAKELLFTGNTIDANRAGEIGLVNQVVPAEELEAVTYGLASNIAGNAPLSVSASKLIISKVVKRSPLSEKDEEESMALLARCLNSYDLQEGVRAFKEKRAPRFEGR